MSEKKDEILYTYNSNVYLNITNACPCKCEFCIRNTSDSVGESDNLWLSHNPSFEEVRAAIDEFDFTNYSEVVFCGYGEPTSSFDVLIKTAQYLREKGIKTRINTNGLGSLIHKRNIAKEICDNIDSISISLNAPTAEKYNAIVHPVFGLKSFDAMLDFAKECRSYTENVALSVVDVMSKEDIEACQKIADSINIKLRVRVYTP
ncbi:MAG: TIGR04100 family radical SAM protein [Lachnospiraceae bacterium]|nr:TIGR04100 family radical SAM protein [Lachnospiraceae bacterium]